MSAKVFKCFKCGEVSSSFQTDIFNVGGKEMKGVVCPKCSTVLYLLPEPEWEEIGGDEKEKKS